MENRPFDASLKTRQYWQSGWLSGY